MSSVHLTFIQILNISLFGFIFGIFETITNGFYLLTNNVELSKIQHGKELPSDVNDRIFRHKVIQMFILGLCLVITSIISIVISPQLFTIAIALIFLNGTLDFVKFRKVEMFILWSAISLLSVLLLMF